MLSDSICSLVLPSIPVAKKVEHEVKGMSGVQRARMELADDRIETYDILRAGPKECGSPTSVMRSAVFVSQIDP